MKVSQQKINILWLKRDLRLTDHQPLQQALLQCADKEKIPLMIFYCIEPSLVTNPHYSERHWRFIFESIDDLNQRLALFAIENNLNSDDTKVWVFQREVLEALEAIQKEFVINQIFSHQETGLHITYQRDKAVGSFCQKYKIQWNEYPNNGVIRGLKNRKGWTSHWFKTMREPEYQVNLSSWIPVPLSLKWFNLEKGEYWQPHDRSSSSIQPGGETWGVKYLNSFLQKRIVNYDKHISKPLESRISCSRLSPYLAWGCLSTKQVYKHFVKNRIVVNSKLFMERLRAQNYFIQVFESDDKMEFENINPNFNSLQRVEDEEQFCAWSKGETGYPLVDASMRCLNTTGYLNFRMRALLISFLTHHLFQDWKKGAFHLARQFTDFEPGIHYAQIQLQVGMFGSEKQPIRIYNPVKQSIDNDPEGVFIKQWIPELQNCPIAYIHTPWKMPLLEQKMSNFEMGKDYPYPIIDAEKTAAYTKQEIYPLRAQYVKFPK